MDYKKLAADIIENVGGPGNIKDVSHCMTRLRFHLKDVSLANKDELENLNGVLGTIYAGGQYMVILGSHLIPVYEIVAKDFNLTLGEVIDEQLDEIKEPITLKNAPMKLLGYVSASVTPLIPGLIAGGMLKVVLLLIVTFINKNFETTSSYALLSAIADAPFYFMPIIVAYGAANKLGSTPVYAMVATAALLHGNFTALVTGGKAVSLFGLPVRAISYGTSLVPALLIAFVACYAEKILNKIVPGIFKSIFVGMGTIFISGALGFLILGPLGNIIGDVIASIFLFFNSTIGPFAVALLAAFLPWMVMAGMHTALAPFFTQFLVNPGYDALLRPAFFIHNMAEGGAVIGVMARSKDKEFRAECISIAIGCIVAGVTEPAIYGVNLKYRKPMFGVMAGGFVGGFVASLLGARAYIMGYSNIIALPIFRETIMAMVIGTMVAIVVAAIVSFVLGIDREESDELTTPVTKTYNDDEIIAIADGELIPLEQVNDAAFSSKALGEGVAFHLENDFITSPANGVLSVLFPTGHAFGITTNDGTELLVHIGIDTVNLKGKGFNVLAKQGDHVIAGQPIIKVDRDLIKQEGYDLTTMLVVTNKKDIALKSSGKVKQGDNINKEV